MSGPDDDGVVPVSRDPDEKAFVDSLTTYAALPSRDVEVQLEIGVGYRAEHQTFRPFDNDPNWPKPESLSREERLMWRARIRGKNTWFHVDGEMPDTKEEHEAVRDRVLKTLDPMPGVLDPTGFEWEVRPLIPGLMSHGTAPAFIGPKGWGKTEFVCGFVPALMIPGHRLLGHFDPAQLTEGERARDVWLLNSETHPGVIHKYLLMNGLKFGYRGDVPCYFHDPTHDYGWIELEPRVDQGVLIVQHLVKTSATEFDLTEPGWYDAWATLVIESSRRRKPPLMVIADGVTAMLGNNTTRYGAFASNFKDWLRVCGIPNGLGVLHSPMGVNTNTPMHGIESMGQWDGMWIGSSPAFPIRPSDKRVFETFPRLGDSRVDQHQVVIDDDGLLKLEPNSKPSKNGAGTGDGTGGGEAIEEVLLARLREGLPDSPRGMWTRDVCPPGGDYKVERAALEKLFTEGKVTRKNVQEGTTRGILWGLPATADASPEESADVAAEDEAEEEEE